MNGHVCAIIQGRLCFLSNEDPVDHQSCLESSNIWQKKCLGGKGILTLLARWNLKIVGQDEVNNSQEENHFSTLNLHVFLHQPQLTGLLSPRCLQYLNSKDSDKVLGKFMFSKLDLCSQNILESGFTDTDEPSGQPSVALCCDCHKPCVRLSCSISVINSSLSFSHFTLEAPWRQGLCLSCFQL